MQSGFPPPPALAGLSGPGDAGRGAPDRVTRPGAVRQAASPWDNLQRRHARHGKVRGSEPKSRDSAPGCSLPASCRRPRLRSARKTRQPTPHPQPQETTSPVPDAPQTSQLSGVQTREIPARSPSPVPSQAMQDRDPVAVPGQRARAPESPGRPADWLALTYADGVGESSVRMTQKPQD